MSGEFDIAFWTTSRDGGGEALAGGGGPFFPFGVSGIFKALPFAIWFFLAIEEVPLAAEESMDPRRDVPKGTVLGDAHAVDRGVLTLFINSGVDGGASATARPVRRSSTASRRSSEKASLLSSSACSASSGSMASFFTIIYAYGRNTYSLSRAGYFPKFLSVTHGARKTPHIALIAGAVVGYLVVLVVWLFIRKRRRAAGRRSSRRC